MDRHSVTIAAESNGCQEEFIFDEKPSFGLDDEGREYVGRCGCKGAQAPVMSIKVEVTRGSAQERK